jgi:hypothetical protein
MAGLLGLLAVVPDWIGLGAPGWGPMQWMILLWAGSLLIVALGMGRLPGRWLLAFFSTVSCLILVLAVLLASQFDLPFLWWNLQQKLTGPAELGIHEHDDLLGWKHRPNRTAHAKHLDFSATYTIDANRMRPSGSPVDLATGVVFLGGSFTFGHGVNDAEPFASVLAREYWPDVSVTNAGVNGWGTVQCFLRLNQLLESEAVRADLVVYVWMSHHAHRNANRASALGSDRRRPIVKFVDGNPVFDRLIDVADGRPDSDQLTETELAISVQLVQAMNRSCSSHGNSFLCLVLPSGYDEIVGVNQRFIEQLTQSGVAVLDLRNIDLPMFPHDGHPTASGHAEIAKQIAQAAMVRQLLKAPAPR